VKFPFPFETTGPVGDGVAEDVEVFVELELLLLEEDYKLELADVELWELELLLLDVESLDEDDKEEPSELELVGVELELEDLEPTELDGVEDSVEEDGDCVLARLDVPKPELVLTTLEEEFV
jgi:hypothetical protein